MANLNLQFQRPQWPTWVVDTLEWDLTLNMVWQLDSGYFIYLWPRLYRDSSKNLTQKQPFPNGDTVIKYFNPIYLPKVSILYFPVCLLFFNGFPSLVTTIGCQHIPQVLFNFKLSFCNKTSDHIFKFTSFKSLKFLHRASVIWLY